MSDKFGIAEAAKHGIELCQVGQRIVLENERVRVREINLDPDEDRIKTVEELGSTVFINRMRAVHRLMNRAAIPYLSHLVEL